MQKPKRQQRVNSEEPEKKISSRADGEDEVMDTGGSRTNPEHESENFREKKKKTGKKRKRKKQKGGQNEGWI